MKLAISFLVVAMAFGCKAKDAPAKSDITAVTAAPAGAVNVAVDEKGFTPSAVTFKKGAPAALVFTRTTDDTCATEVVFPDLGIKKPLPKNTPVTITIPTDKEQKLTFQCGMGMFKSSVVIGS